MDMKILGMDYILGMPHFLWVILGIATCSLCTMAATIQPDDIFYLCCIAAF